MPQHGLGGCWLGKAVAGEVKGVRLTAALTPGSVPEGAGDGGRRAWGAVEAPACGLWGCW